jgi:RHH-type transcriptional regulator, proline utilization regulon repressor / proline dehydrogenase / delta 1-pyrroline-5-carboxylate dehydrogenase
MRLPTAYLVEADTVARNLSHLQGALDWAAASGQAQPWVQAVRDNPPPFWAMESLLKEYPISSAEGLALMRLAEALLRVPDVETAIALTTDQLGRADFDGSGDAVLARLSSAAIGMSKHFLPLDANTQPGLMAKLGARTVVAATLRAVALLGKQFVLGQTIDEAQNIARQSPDLTYSYDMLGEGARTERDAQGYLASYTNAIQSIAARAIKQRASGLKSTQNTAHSSTENPLYAADGISIKLSALHPRYEAAQHARVMAELVPRVWGLCTLAAQANINLTIDTEEVDRLELSLDVVEALLEKIAAHAPQWHGFGLALQAYQSRALDLIEHVAALARQHGVRLMCRLVKGAYWDAEIKRAQELGLPHYPVFTHKHHTDISYLACARALLAHGDVIYPQFATHNAGTIAAILQMASRSFGPQAPPLRGSLPPEGAQPSLGRPGAGLGSQFELQRLHGMGEGIYREVLKNPLVRCRVYAPVGAHRDLLAYLVRRLLENGANSSFVHQLTDESVGMDTLLTSPLRLDSTSAIPLPRQLYGPSRANSAGIDLTDAAMCAPLLQALHTTVVPQVPEFDAKLAASALLNSTSSYQIWSKLPAEKRTAVLRSAADALEQQMPQFCALLVKEAFKTWGDAVAEVREAVDFLRYYANEADRIMQPQAMPGHSQGTTPRVVYGVTGETNTLQLKPRGVWVCISPWNFPLAIFMGQVAAALATGNTVLAKPAEQTPGVAHAAVALLHAALRQAGLTDSAAQGTLQLCHGPGETVGAALVALEGIAGVVFTGSTQVAKIINRALAAKDGAIIPLIAETGGINAMVVDSSALPEQVCDAVMQSAFKSAGQRCSALRLLCLHEAIADHVLKMIAGAAAELSCGDSALLATDVPRVIDTEAYLGIQQHIQRLNREEKSLLAQQNLAQAATNLIVPQLFEVRSIAHVKAEIFGPVLQVVRYSGDPAQVIAQINALGYGLTLGIQTRIDSRAAALASAAHIGNVYINRNMIGAVVGVQPFGGEGLSGTGPKAGGPHYLYRFCAEQTVTVNTTAAGGNAALLAG